MTSRQPSILVASNRGPLSFSTGDDGQLRARRGGGGLVSGLSAIDPAAGALWVCAAMSEADRQAATAAPDGRLDLAGHDTGGQAVRMLRIPADTFERAYNAVANSTLWFVHHLLYDLPNQPVFDEGFGRDWEAYRRYNEAFARALAEQAGPEAKVLVQDYHLTLVPGMLRELRPDLRIGHFSHTPWAPADYFRLLPEAVGREILTSLLAADNTAFHSPRWAQAFADCCTALLDAEVKTEESAISYDGRLTRLGVHPLGADGEFLRARAAQADVAGRMAALRETVGDRRLIVRVDRTELSKNIVRGLLAYRDLLRTQPEWRGEVVHLAFAYPSRHDLPEYREYTAAVQRTARQINDEFGHGDWQPVVLEVNDDFPRSLAAYRLADVVLVNPIRDGMNLVAKEAPVLSDDGCALVLSQEAGAHDELGPDALVVHPFDVSGTARALDAALRMDPAERRARCRRLAAAATAVPPDRWLTEQLEALG